ncbi:hypothetical protein O181_038921 [Austropuccinia psidii MF-1]|uniref:Uncharacterized protein n=1 Tax=Austropuccinia psidii MF-1 TaxID=1389203 RepID=A0A9Q3DEX4_9BASI|nr:hypothetical protein [Austropuccinia psidii MF-1]
MEKDLCLYPLRLYNEDYKTGKTVLFLGYNLRSSLGKVYRKPTAYARQMSTCPFPPWIQNVQRGPHSENPSLAAIKPPELPNSSCDMAR